MKVFLTILILALFFSCGTNEIPKPSMEKELLVGDFLFVDSLNYGIKNSIKNNSTNESLIYSSLKSELINDYYKQIYLQENIIKADEHKQTAKLTR